VTDAYNQRVFFRLGRAGDTLILHGTAPFSVLLGFAHGVQMEFNGQPFDLASHSRSGVAHFTLGRSPAEVQPQNPAREEPPPGAEGTYPDTEEPFPGTTGD
jgi:hypothetical protein